MFESFWSPSALSWRLNFLATAGWTGEGFIGAQRIFISHLDLELESVNDVRFKKLVVGDGRQHGQCTEVQTGAMAAPYWEPSQLQVAPLKALRHFIWQSALTTLAEESASLHHTWKTIVWLMILGGTWWLSAARAVISVCIPSVSSTDNWIKAGRCECFCTTEHIMDMCERSEWGGFFLISWWCVWFPGS